MDNDIADAATEIVSEARNRVTAFSAGALLLGGGTYLIGTWVGRRRQKKLEAAAAAATKKTPNYIDATCSE